MTDDSSVDGTHTVAQGDVEVTRRLETDGRALIGHVQLRSTAAEPVVVELIDRIPDDVTVESVAFDPDTGPDDGTAGTESIRVEHEVGEEPARVVYGVMLPEPAEPTGFEPPRIVRTRAAEPAESAEPAVADGGMADAGTENEQDAGATLSLADADGTGDDDGTEAGGDTSGEAADAGDGRGEDPPARGPAIDADLPAGDDAAPETGENEANDADRSDDADGPDGEPRSVALRVDRLSARVEEFAAYAEAMESFIDERGTADEFAAHIEGRVDGAEADVERMREDLDEGMSDLRADVAAVEEEVADLRAETEEMRGEVSSLAEDVAEVRELRETLATAFDR